MKRIILIFFALFFCGNIWSQGVFISSFSFGFNYRQLYSDGEFVKNTNLPNFDFRWRIEIFPEKAFRLSIQPGVFSRLYSLRDEMYNSSYTSNRYLCPAVSVNIEKHFNYSNETDKWCLFGGVTITNLYENGVEWRSFKWLDWVDFTPFSYYFQIGGMYRINKKAFCYTQFNYPWIRNLYYLPINVGLGTNNTPGAYLGTPTLGNERWSITAGVVFKLGKKHDG